MKEINLIWYSNIQILNIVIHKYFSAILYSFFNCFIFFFLFPPFGNIKNRKLTSFHMQNGITPDIVVILKIFQRIPLLRIVTQKNGIQGLI